MTTAPPPRPSPSTTRRAALLDHVALCPADIKASTTFYRDGVGLDVLADATFTADLEELLGVQTQVVRTVFLGCHGQLGTVELLALDTADVAADTAAAATPRRGLYLLSFQVAVDETLARLASLGLGGRPRRMQVGRNALAAVVSDPDGVQVELLDQPVSLLTR